MVTEAPPSLELCSEELVEQNIAEGRRGRFRKQILRARLSTGRSLAIVRKFCVDETESSESDGSKHAPSSAAVLFVHGFAQNRYSWHLEAMSPVNMLAEQGMDTYNLELAGHGRSREFGSRAPRQFSGYVDDLAEVIELTARHSGHGPVFLVGHSMGAAVIYGAAPLIRDQVAGVITLGGIYKFGGNPVVFWGSRLLTVGDRRTRMFRGTGIAMNSEALGRLMTRYLPLVDRLSERLPISGWVPGSTDIPLIEERIRRGFDWTGLNVTLQMLSWAVSGEMLGEDGVRYGERFAQLDCPLLVIAGDQDELATPDDVRPAWERSASTDKRYLELSPLEHEVSWGHLCIVLGRLAPVYVWPTIIEWIQERSKR